MTLRANNPDGRHSSPFARSELGGMLRGVFAARTFRRKRRTAAFVLSLLLAAGLALAVAACGGDDEPAQEAGSPQTVRIVIGPYLDPAPWLVAHELGLDKEQGINIEVSTETTEADQFALLRRGDADMAGSCHACTYPLLESFPDVRDWQITNHFKGFILIGRRGDALTYDELSQKKSPKEAKTEIVQSWKGKEFALYGAFFRGLVKNALEDEGLTLDDVTILDFAGDPAAALAFINGEGDFFVGGLPQSTKLLKDFSDQFVSVGGHEVLGRGGLWYSTTAATNTWLSENEEAAMKLMAIWYRTMAFLRQDLDQSAELMAELINSTAATNFTPEEVALLIREPQGLLGFYTLDEAQERIFDPASDTNWRLSAEFYARASEDVLPDDFSIEQYLPAQEYFDRFLEREDLIEWVNGPFEE